MIEFKQGEIVLVRFIFTDESGTKRRPAVIISTAHFHQNRQEMIISAITSNTDRILPGDHNIEGWREAGLLFPSVATAIIRTVKHSMIERRIGNLSAGDFEGIQNKLKEVLGL